MDCVDSLMYYRNKSIECDYEYNNLVTWVILCSLVFVAVCCVAYKSLQRHQRKQQKHQQEEHIMEKVASPA